MTMDHPDGQGGCGCRHALCEYCGNPGTPTFWVMEVFGLCRNCRGAGAGQGTCVACGGTGKLWMPVRPTRGEVYRFDEQDKAARTLRMCYPDACRDARLGGEPEVRITLCVEGHGRQLLRAVDQTVLYSAGEGSAS